MLNNSFSHLNKENFFCEFYVILLMNIFIKRAYLTSRSKLDSVQGGKYLQATSTLRNGDQEQHVLLQPVIGKLLSIQNSPAVKDTKVLETKKTLNHLTFLLSFRQFLCD